MGFDSLGKIGIPKDIYMMLNPNGIDVHLNTYQGNTWTWLNYESSDDLFYADRNGKDFDDEMIRYLLDFKIPAESLSDYHRQIIENSPSTYKKVEIHTEDEDFDKSNFNLLINEDIDKITLTKTKIRKR